MDFPDTFQLAVSCFSFTQQKQSDIFLFMMVYSESLANKFSLHIQLELSLDLIGGKTG